MAVVVDVGAHLIKAGWAGNEFPTTRYGTSCIIDGDHIEHCKYETRGNCTKDIQNVVTKGELQRPAYDVVMDEIMKLYHSDTVFWVKSADHSRLMGNQSFEMFFEKMNIQKLYSAPSPVLVALSNAAVNGIVVECGCTTCRCSIVFKGYVLEHSTTYTTQAGNFISQRILERVMRDSPNTIPQPPDNSTPTFKQYHNLQFIEHLKEVPTTFKSFDITSFSNALLFPQEPQTDNIGLDNMVAKSLLKCDYDVLMKCSQQLILAGGCSLIPGIAEKITTTLNTYFPQLQPTTLVPQSPLAQHFAAWKGASIVANTESMNNLWVTKADFDEYGVGIVDRRCG
ncbi:actin [Entamoeba marina]